MMRHCGYGGWAHWVWMGETFLLWAVVIAAVVLIARYLLSLRGTGAPSATGAPREEGVLAERFARGEIDDGEYERRLTVLKQHR